MFEALDYTVSLREEGGFGSSRPSFGHMRWDKNVVVDVLYGVYRLPTGTHCTKAFMSRAIGIERNSLSPGAGETRILTRPYEENNRGPGHQTWRPK